MTGYALTTIRPQITEAMAEAMADRLVWRKIATDRAYRNAENAHDQAAREDAIAKEVWATITDRYEVAR